MYSKAQLVTVCTGQTMPLGSFFPAMVSHSYLGSDVVLVCGFTWTFKLGPP